MIKCISYWSLKDGLAGTHGIDAAVSEVKAAGYAGIELAIGAEGVLHPESTQGDCEIIRDQVDAVGLTAESVASGLGWGFNAVSNDANTRKESVALHDAALQRVAWLGAEAMLMVPGVVRSPISPNEIVRYDHAVDRLREALKPLLDTAERVGVDLCLENVWNGLFYSPLEFAQFVDSVGSRRLGVYFDVGNVLGYQQHPPHWIEILGSRIKRVHVKDFVENFGWTGGYAFCGLLAGQVPWPETMAALRTIGYDRTLVAEMLPWDPALLARTSAAMDVILNM